MFWEKGFWGLEIELSEECNLTCSYCPQSHMATTLNPNLLEKAIITHDWKAVELTGGEPFLKPELIEKAVILARKKEICEIVAYSNGTIPLSENYLEHLKSLGLSALHFSVFSLKRELWEKFRRGTGEQFSTLLSNLKTASKILPVWAEIMWTRHNHDEIFESAETLWKMGVNYVELQYPIPTAIYEGLEPTLDQVKEVMSKANLYATILPRPIIINCFFIPMCILPRNPVFFFDPCICGKGLLCLKPDGKVSICNLTNRIMGDLNEQSWREIFSRTQGLLNSLELERGFCENCYSCSKTSCYSFENSFKGNYREAYLDWQAKHKPGKTKQL